MSIKAGIMGGTGYTGTQLASLLINHPEVDLKWVTSEKFKNKQFYESFPHLKSLVNIECKSVSNLDELCDVDVVFSCLPSLTSMNFISKMVEKGARAIDLSPDFRFTSTEKFKEFFKAEHDFKELNERAVYGLPEINRLEIADTQLVANPGCFATSVALALMPFFENDLVPEDELIIDIKAPVSGAGRAPRLEYHFPETNQNITFDSYDKHFQKLEIGEHLAERYGFNNDFVFMVHRIPVDRGILSTVYLKLHAEMPVSEIAVLISDFYKGEEFIRVYGPNEPVSLKNVINSNFCDIGIGEQGSYLVVQSVIDNLIKGASGQALQNMNIMFGLDENAGLGLIPLYP